MAKRQVRERTKAFKDMTFKEKVEHIWEYYKWAVFGIIAGIALIIYIIYKIVCPDPESILNVTMVNSMPAQMEREDIFQRYLTEQGYDLEKEKISVNSNLYLEEDMGPNSAAAYQALTAMVMVGEIDILAGSREVLDIFGRNGAFTEMKDILGEARMEQYKDRLYTAKDEETGEEYVCGIRLPENNLLTKNGYYGEEVWVGFPATSKRQELAIKVFLYLLGE